ncbi:PilZ domain-containing protein [Hydrogenovibrio sp. SC-1]|uniref:PilZ domain-containing protein n=1 Tax=Hydrogenovibrio sp. SC-1 TaxID=2065820 RepID=UPI000C7BDF8C|nr:PilZ domain-containing protein [Hydrogenovibrio sp. SC-1]PLA73923.1 PilZ domain-containing protein [Hydrogenovibrio sp. SC-1]
MIQMDLEQRQSMRFERPFYVTNHEDETFSAAFEGADVNLTGLGFLVDDPDLFLPHQQLSLRVRNEQSDEVYCLEGVEVIHLRPDESGQYLCGCHIAQVTSGQLLAHHRLVMTDADTALVSMEASKLSEFNFLEDGSALSKDEADFQEASMALNLAVTQSENNQKEVMRFLNAVDSLFDCPLDAETKLQELKEEFSDFRLYLQQMNDSTVAFATLAKLLAHTPDNTEDKLAWRTLIADFEARFLTEKQQVAYDFMHQGLDAVEALEIANEYLKK